MNLKIKLYKKTYNFLKAKQLKESGITLIALIVTIIILLILAGVSISTLTGDSGIINQAQNAKNKTEISQNIEEIELMYIEVMKNRKSDNITNLDVVNKFKEILSKKQKEFSNIVYLKDNGLKITRYNGKDDYYIDKNGNVTVHEHNKNEYNIIFENTLEGEEWEEPVFQYAYYEKGESFDISNIFPPNYNQLESYKFGGWYVKDENGSSKNITNLNQITNLGNEVILYTEYLTKFSVFLDLSDNIKYDDDVSDDDYAEFKIARVSDPEDNNKDDFFLENDGNIKTVKQYKDHKTQGVNIFEVYINPEKTQYIYMVNTKAFTGYDKLNTITIDMSEALDKSPGWKIISITPKY